MGWSVQPWFRVTHPKRGNLQKAMGISQKVAEFQSFSGSTIITLLHEKINPKHRQVASPLFFNWQTLTLISYTRSAIPRFANYEKNPQIWPVGKVARGVFQFGVLKQPQNDVIPPGFYNIVIKQCLVKSLVLLIQELKKETLIVAISIFLYFHPDPLEKMMQFD